MMRRAEICRLWTVTVSWLPRRPFPLPLAGEGALRGRITSDCPAPKGQGIARLVQRHLLHPQIANLADVKIVLAAAVDGVDEVEFLRGSPGPAELADHGAVKFGRAGRAAKEFNFVNAIDCRSENDL